MAQQNGQKAQFTAACGELELVFLLLLLIQVYPQPPAIYPGSLHITTEVILGLGCLAESQGDYIQAKQHFLEAWQRDHGVSSYSVSARNGLGRVALVQGKIALAKQHCTETCQSVQNEFRKIGCLGADFCMVMTVYQTAIHMVEIHRCLLEPG